MPPTHDVPVPLMVEQLLDILLFFDTLFSVVAEQVIEVPKITIQHIPPRTSAREPQLAEQLVEVPTILYFLKQTVDISVPRGRGSRLQRFLPEQNPTAQSVEQIVDIPVPGGGLQGFRSGQDSAAPFSSPAGVHEDANEPGVGVFSRPEKVRRSTGTRVRECSGTSAHPRFALIKWLRAVRPCLGAMKSLWCGTTRSVSRRGAALRTVWADRFGVCCMVLFFAMPSSTVNEYMFCVSSWVFLAVLLLFSARKRTRILRSFPDGEVRTVVTSVAFRAGGRTWKLDTTSTTLSNLAVPCSLFRCC